MRDELSGKVFWGESEKDIYLFLMKYYSIKSLLLFSQYRIPLLRCGHHSSPITEGPIVLHYNALCFPQQFSPLPYTSLRSMSAFKGQF